MALTTEQIAAASERVRSFSNITLDKRCLLKIEKNGYYDIFINKQIELEILGGKLYSARSGITPASGAFTISIISSGENSYLIYFDRNSDTAVSALDVVSSTSEIEISPSNPPQYDASSGTEYTFDYGKEYSVQGLYIKEADIDEFKADSLLINELNINTIKLGNWSISAADNPSVVTIGYEA